MDFASGLGHITANWALRPIVTMPLFEVLWRKPGGRIQKPSDHIKVAVRGENSSPRNMMGTMHNSCPRGIVNYLISRISGGETGAGLYFCKIIKNQYLNCEKKFKWFPSGSLFWFPFPASSTLRLVLHRHIMRPHEKVLGSKSLCCFGFHHTGLVLCRNVG